MPKKKTKTTPWNVQDYLKTPKDIANYLESALEENDAEYTIIAVKDAITALRNLALKDATKDPTSPLFNACMNKLQCYADRKAMNAILGGTTTTELIERERISNKKLAKCNYYRKKCDFWGPAMLIDLGLTLIVLWVTKWALLSLILFGLIYIPACIRLSQYGKAVNDL